MKKEKQKEEFLLILKNLPVQMRNYIDELKKGSEDLKRPDFIWHFLLQSFSTMGNSKGYYGLILNKANYNAVTFEAVAELTNEQRLIRFSDILRQAKVRMSEQKAIWLQKNYNLIVAMGGLETVKKQLFAQNGKDGKIHFLKRFHGIADKYARNIMMDVYHPDFHNAIAIDSRISQITEALGYTFSDYQEHENFYLDIAEKAGLNGWELDRLLYNYSKFFIAKLTELKTDNSYITTIT